VLPFALLAFSWLGRTRLAGLPATIELDGRRVQCLVGDPSELEVLREIFQDRPYDLRLPAAAVHTIVDLGSNAGLSVIFFKHLYPAARVIAVEPNPRVLPRLRANVRGLDGVTVVPAAVASKDGQIALVDDTDTWAARTDPSVSDAANVVRAITLASLFDEHGLQDVDLLKFDIEGAEFAALESGDLSRIDHLVGELHPEYGDVCSLVSSLAADFEVTLAGVWTPTLRARRRRRTA